MLESIHCIRSGGFSGIYGHFHQLECRCGCSVSDFGPCCRLQAGETFWNVPLAFQGHLWPHLLFTLLFLPLCLSWQSAPVPGNCWSKVRSPRTWRIAGPHELVYPQPYKLLLRQAVPSRWGWMLGALQVRPLNFLGKS